MSKTCKICNVGELEAIQETRTITPVIMGKKINFTHTYDEEYCPECELIYTSPETVDKEEDAYLKCLSENGIDKNIIETMRKQYSGEEDIADNIASNYKPVDYTGIKISSSE